MGGGTRFKVSKRMAVTLDYHHYFGTLNENNTDPLSLGLDIETGGHVFQIVLTNSQGMREGGFIGKTNGSWLNGDIHIGFNISRVFTLDNKTRK